MKGKIVLYIYRQFHYIQKIDDIYKNIAGNVKTRFDTLNFELDRPQPKEKRNR